jgi:hypothetical protein
MKRTTKFVYITKKWTLFPWRSHVIVQAVSRQFPAVAAWVRNQARSCGICGEQNGTGVGFLRVLRFILPILSTSCSILMKCSLIEDACSRYWQPRYITNKKKYHKDRATWLNWWCLWLVSRMCYVRLWAGTSTVVTLLVHSAPSGGCRDI